ncbi:MAG: hypothetical protein ACD_3C00111G0033 [uncultured bacterium (gcode 4)]|uniref:Uncharacterized protein n=1 Tax=uncultured bacterium (gcode 4) TaxID=1234023 RepID=K2FA52_9BACT|nr:MAG: hypothetical protein ACD_3C00111G0033 [uncultured bacterium (gcode 4)]
MHSELRTKNLESRPDSWKLDYETFNSQKGSFDISGLRNPLSLSAGRQGWRYPKTALNSKTSVLNPRAFTLVELIVVIVILAILATIAFLSFSSQSASARDSTRLADLSNISKWLWVFQATAWTYLLPDGPITVTAWTWYIIYQWAAWSRLLSILHSSDAKDALDGNYYSYSLDSTKTHYTIWAFLENPPISFRLNPLDLSFPLSNALDYSKRYAFIKWDPVWILVESWTNTPIEQTVASWTIIDLYSTSKQLNLNLSKTNTVVWTWLIVWVIQTAQNWNYSSSAPANCPIWFVSVPWNQEFNQPGFCVMKYEAKALNWIINSWFNWHSYSWTDVVVSNPQDVSIVNVTQPQAITACRSMWVWYHLITENEWMTIARNIELSSNNWTSWMVWSWYIHNWHVNNNPAVALTGSSDDSNWFYWITWWTWTTSAFNNKRTLTLSNWNVIWDFAWNVWEHVNKANTLDATNIDSNNFSLESACNNWTWAQWSWYWNDWVAECQFQNWYLRTSYWPGWAYNSNQWVWRIYANNTEDRNNVFIRWDNWMHMGNAWIYTLNLQQRAVDSDYSVGFRCTK